MYLNIQRKLATCRAIRSLGVAIGLVVLPSLARAEMNEMPGGQMPPSGTQQPATNQQPSDQGSGTMQPGMGMGMGMEHPGMGAANQGQGMGTPQSGTGMNPQGMGPGTQGQGMGMMGMMGMKMMGGGIDMGNGMGGGQGMQGRGGQMGGMQRGVNQPGATSMPNGAPNQPAASNVLEATRLYHAGSTDFFLDQGDKLNLTSKQTADITEIKRKSLVATEELQTKIAQSEKELFALTGADTPNESTIANKVKDIERLRGEQRLNFIKSVGKAGRVLNDTQRKIYLAH